MGLGIEGVALIEFLRGKVAGLTVCDKSMAEVILDRAEPDLTEKIKLILADTAIEKIFGEKYLDGLEQFDIVFRSPAVYFADPALLKAKAKGVVVLSQMKLFFALCPCPIIGVTGTKGKGTTASLILEILRKKSEIRMSKSERNPNIQIPNSKEISWRAQDDKSFIINNDPTLSTENCVLSTVNSVYLAGNIGKPAITLVPALKKDDVIILELSNFQLADLDQSPHIAVVTNLGVDHLDYHKDEAEYRAAKKNIVLWQGSDDFAVLNHNSTFNLSTLTKSRGQIKYFARDNSLVDCAVVDENGISKVILDPQGRNIEICEINDLNIVGRHNLDNVAAAAIVADILDVPAEIIRQAVKRFVGLPHRLELIAEINKVRYINDSFATSPDPTMAAINSFSEDKILILGGSSKGADFTVLAETIAGSAVKGVILIGVEGPRIKKALKTADFRGHIISGSQTMAEIVRKASAETRRGDVVIFSPACASFDLFKNYKERGEKFKEEVLKLMPKS